MKLVDALRLSQLNPTTVRAAFVGSGGKTSLMFQAGRELTPPVLVTTSTHLGDWQPVLADNHTIVEDSFLMSKPDRVISVDGVTLLTGGLEGKRFKGLNQNLLNELHQFANQYNYPILVEADGSRQLPIKAPGEHEPAIPQWAQQVIVVVGLSGLGKQIGPDVVHRPERYASLLNLPVGSMITEECIAQSLLHPNGGKSKIPNGIQSTVILNQADHPGLIAAGHRIAQNLVDPEPGKKFDRAILTSFRYEGSSQGIVHGVIEPVAGIVLAAGESTRFGSPKIMIDWNGKPLIRHIVEIGLAGGLWPMIVVLGPVTDRAIEILKDLPVQVNINPSWAEGQSTSLKAGIKMLQDKHVGAAVFLLADQPFISAELIANLRQEHAVSLAPVIAPMVNGQRTSPTLIDRAAFNDLMQIQGDVGGRAIFKKYPPHYFFWKDNRLLIDIDTLQDFQNLTKGLNDRSE